MRGMRYLFWKRRNVLKDLPTALWSLHWNNNPWGQGPSVGYELRYDLAGQGTSGDPGIHWYFDHVQQLRGAAPEPLGAPGRPVPVLR